MKFQLKRAIFSLVKRLNFSLTVILTIGTGFGVLLSVLTLSYFLLIKPMPYPEQGKLYVAEHKLLGSNSMVKGIAYTYPSVMHLYKNQDVFSDGSAIIYSEDIVTSMPSQPMTKSSYVTPEYFSILGVKMAGGRAFNASEGVDEFNPVVVISHSFWREYFKSDKDILNKRLTVRGVSFSIVGVMEESFSEPQLMERGRNSDVWLPWDYNDVDLGKRKSWGNISGTIFYVGKLNKGMSPVQAQQAITPLVNDRWREGVNGKPFFEGWRVQMTLTSLKDFVIGDSASLATMLLIGVVGLIIIVCINISCLFMSRTIERQHDMAIQAAVGARKNHLFLSTLFEVVILMSLSIALSVLVSHFCFSIFKSYFGSVFARVNDLTISEFTLMAAVFFAIALSLLFSRLSLSVIDYKTLQRVLQRSGKGGGLQISSRKQFILVSAQIAFATVLVFINVVLFFHSLNVMNSSSGFVTENIVKLDLSVAGASRTKQSEIGMFLEDLRGRLELAPEIEAISQSESPVSGFSKMALTNVMTGDRYTPGRKVVDDKYFSMIEQEIVDGRNFTGADVDDERRVIIVNQAFVKKWGDSILGTRLSAGKGEPYEVIGVVQSISLINIVPEDPRVYTLSNKNMKRFLIKLKEGATLSRSELARIVTETSSLYAVREYEPLSVTYRLILFGQIATAITTSALTILILLLAGVGIYGILNYSLQLRRYELGTRLALGAKGSDLVRLVLKDNSTSILWGFLTSAVILCCLYLIASEFVDSYIGFHTLIILFLTLLTITCLSFLSAYIPLRPIIRKFPIYSLRDIR